MTGPITHEALRQGIRLGAEVCRALREDLERLKQQIAVLQWDLSRHKAQAEEVTITGIRLATLRLAESAAEIDKAVVRAITKERPEGQE